MSAFPDYGKAPPEYLLTITELIAGYADAVQKHICDTRSGIPSRENFLPSAKKIMDFADEVIRHQEFQKKMKDKVVVLEGTPAWDAWKGMRQGSLTAFDIPGKGRGWYFPTEFP